MRTEIQYLQILFSALSFLTAFLYFLKYNNWILDCNQYLLQEDFDHCFPEFCKNQYLPKHFHTYVSILANGIYPGLVSCSYIQTIQ